MQDPKTDRRRFIKSTFCCAATCMAARAVFAAPPTTAAGAAGSLPDAADAATIHDWLTRFITSEENSLDRAALSKLLEQRGRLCCARLDFRRAFVRDAGGDVDRLVHLLAERVGPENCRREGDSIVLVYPLESCGCGWSPKREPSPDDPYCDCSRANNQQLFETVSGGPVQVEVTDSRRRNGQPCRFVIRLG